MTPINPFMSETPFPPIMQAQRWVQDAHAPRDRALINVSQAAPTDPPPAALRQAIAEAALNDPSVHLYGPVLGRPDLRAQVAQEWTASYGGAISSAQVAITAGCNQAFCAAIATLARTGDEVILPSPWYFSHKMWLDMSGITTVPLITGAELLPDPDRAAALITPRTRAIVLVTPNNPGGVEYPADLVHAFYRLARDNGLALIIDETYRDFDSRPSPPHDLFGEADWPATLIQLYSFSKAYRLTGHRVGAIVAGCERLAQVEKFLDSVTICPNQLGQHAALWGMQNLSQWLTGARAEILDRRAAIEEGFAQLGGGWSLLGAGAYFAYVTHPYQAPSPEVAKTMVEKAGILALPGSMFTPDGDADGLRQMRFAFANVDRTGIAELFRRLAALSM